MQSHLAQKPSAPSKYIKNRISIQIRMYLIHKYKSNLNRNTKNKDSKSVGTESWAAPSEYITSHLQPGGHMHPQSSHLDF